MKTVLCYGDSLTWGYNPSDGIRYPFEQRWPGVLQRELSDSVRVIEEALSGRTAATDS
jgi:lysophospholipase L1-like esterase